MHKFVKELDPTVVGQKTCLIELDGKHYVISSILNGPENKGPETLAFAADSEGEVESWADLAGGLGKTREETIAELETRGEVEYSGTEHLDVLDAIKTIAMPPGESYYTAKGKEANADQGPEEAGREAG